MNRLILSSDICPVCLEKGRGRIHLTTPEKCSGFHTAENDGRFYQRVCLRSILFSLTANQNLVCTQQLYASEGVQLFLLQRHYAAPLWRH
jgi:hypothetical protein